MSTFLKISLQNDKPHSILLNNCYSEIGYFILELSNLYGTHLSMFDLRHSRLQFSVEELKQSFSRKEIEQLAILQDDYGFVTAILPAKAFIDLFHKIHQLFRRASFEQPIDQTYFVANAKDQESRDKQVMSVTMGRVALIHDLGQIEGILKFATKYGYPVRLLAEYS